MGTYQVTCTNLTTKRRSAILMCFACLVAAWLVAACAPPAPEIVNENLQALTSADGGPPSWSPLDVEAIRHGRAWIPGNGVTQSGGSTYWDSLQGGDAWTSSGIAIALETAPNGRKFWDVSAPYAAWAILDPSAVLEDEVLNYAWAGWFKAKSQTTTSSHVLWARWPENCANNRDYAWIHADWSHVSYEFSWLGIGADVGPPCGVLGEGDRGKGNVTAPPFGRWVFVRLTVQYSDTIYHEAGQNYSKASTLQSTIAMLRFNEELQEGTGWSAPQPEYGGAPPAGPMRGQHVFASTATQWLAARNYGQQGPWLVGPQYYARGDAPDEAWRHVMEYEAPQD